jgi:hypothetical protein
MVRAGRQSNRRFCSERLLKRAGRRRIDASAAFAGAPLGRTPRFLNGIGAAGRTFGRRLWPLFKKGGLRLLPAKMSRLVG